MALIEESYPMDMNGKYRGMGIIIVNHFRNQGSFRAGAKNDEENLSVLFEAMGLEVVIHTELTKPHILDVLIKAAEQPRLKNDSMLAVAISSHGCEDGLLGIEYEGLPGAVVTTNKIREIFNGKNCPNLVKKPKILLLNGCRGSGKEEPIERIESDNIIKHPEHPVATKWSDFFIIHSCEMGLISLRSNLKGSLFIDEFRKTYLGFGHIVQLDLMMIIVNRKLIDVSMSGAVFLSAQSCTWESSCTYALKIPPIGHPQALPVETADSFKLVWGTCTKGLQGPNQMSTPGGVITTPDGQIYITDSASKCIWVYSGDGDPLYQDINQKTYKQLSIGNLGLAYCWGMCIKEQFLFVSCTLALIKFSLVGGGLLTHKFHDAPITGMDVDDEFIIYACERHSCKILKLDKELNVKPDRLDLTHTLDAANDRLMDIKVVNDELYVLVNKNAHTIQIFDKEGIHRRNLISSADLRECLFFTMNKTKKTIFAGDIVTNELKAFSPNGELMYKTGCHGDRRGDLIEPSGIDLNDNGEVVIVSANKTKFMLQCFELPPNM